MKGISKISTTTAIVSTLLLVAVGTGAYLTYDQLDQKNKELEAQLAELTKREQQSVVMQHVNAQMEEIANEERRISDEQRDEAKQQAQLAQQERQNADEQRRQAEVERQNALVAERKAVEASQTAKSQQAIAEQQRAEAEYSKRVTDTLNYLTLARNLGNTAITQFNAGNYELADLLAYTSVNFTNRYHGEIYAPMVYRALAATSQNKSVWNKHKGSVTDIAFTDTQGYDFVSCSTYGELLRHHISNGKLQTTTLFSDSHYDFRDVYVDRKSATIYVLSRTGHLFSFKNDKIHLMLYTGIRHLNRIEVCNGQFILFGEQQLATFTPANGTVGPVKELPYKIVCICLTESLPLLFDNQGRQHQVKSIDNITTSKVPYSGQVTAYAESKHAHLKAYGMNDGTIYLVNSQGKATRLTGHRSRISKLKMNGERLYSASFDGTLHLWLTDAAKIEPMVLFSTNGWIINFTYDPQKNNIWTGDQKGNLTEALISVPTMIKRLENKLKRNLTREEWRYYVGRNIPYEKYIGKEGQP